jgi:hypothetical protein
VLRERPGEREARGDGQGDEQGQGRDGQGQGRCQQARLGPEDQTHTKPTTKKAPAKKHAKTKSAPPCKLCGAAAKRAAMLKAKKR